MGLGALLGSMGCLCPVGAMGGEISLPCRALLGFMGCLCPKGLLGGLRGGLPAPRGSPGVYGVSVPPGAPGPPLPVPTHPFREGRPVGPQPAGQAREGPGEPGVTQM